MVDDFGQNPYQNKRIPREDIVAAIADSPSMRQAGQYLGVSYKTFKKYAMEYGV
jgi:molybdenum-dependent DNA-binding transcriptional regulator ModE